MNSCYKRLCLLGCWQLSWIHDGVSPAQSSLRGSVSVLGKGKRAPPPSLPQDWVRSTTIGTQGTLGIFHLVLE